MKTFQSFLFLRGQKKIGRPVKIFFKKLGGQFLLITRFNTMYYVFIGFEVNMTFLYEL